MQTCEQVMYLKGKKFFILKMIGTLRFTCVTHLETALNHFLPYDEKNAIIIDMTEVKHIDSTILGSIAKFFLQAPLQQKESSKFPVIVCSNPDIKKIFIKTGFDAFFTFKDKDERVNKSLKDYSRVEEIAVDEKRLENEVLSAHQTLNELQPKDADLQLIIKTLKGK